MKTEEDPGRWLTALYGKPGSAGWSSAVNDLVEILEETVAWRKTGVRCNGVTTRPEPSTRLVRLWECGFEMLAKAAEARDASLFFELAKRIDVPRNEALKTTADPMNAGIDAKLTEWRTKRFMRGAVNIAHVQERLAAEGIRASYQTVRRALVRGGAKFSGRGNPELGRKRKE